MATNDGTLKFDTKIDDGGFNTGVSKIGSLAKNTFKAVGAAALGLTATITATAGAVLAVGNNYNMKMESYVTNFGTMLGSMEKGQKLMEDMAKTAAETPLEMESLAQATQTLLAFNAATEDNVLDTLTMLGDIALGDAEKLKSLSRAYGQISAAGRLTGEDLNQLIDVGFNPLLLISEKTGESMAELRDRMSEGAISVEEVQWAFKTATSEGGQFYNAMLNQSKTAAGQMSTLKDNVQALAGELTKTFTTDLSSYFLPNINDVVSRALDAVKSEGIGGLLPLGKELIQETINNIKTNLPLLIEQGKNIINSLLEGWAENQPAVYETVFNLVNNISLWLKENFPAILQKGKELLLTFINGILERLPGLISAAAQIIGTLVTMLIENLPQILETGWQIIYTIGQGILDRLPELLAIAWELIKTLATALVDNAPAILEAIENIIDNMWEAFKNNMANVIDWGKNIISWILDGLKAGWYSVLDWVKEKLNYLKDVFNPKNWFTGGGSGDTVSNQEKFEQQWYKDSLEAALNRGEESFTFDEWKEAGGHAPNWNPETNSPKTSSLTVNFNQPVESPDETVKKINNYYTYGLVGR